MQAVLTPHPISKKSLVRAISVEWERKGEGNIWLRYHIEVDAADIKLPSLVTIPKRKDGLWETTCFEMFVHARESERYAEYNFSPSSNWAAYQFSAHREGMKSLELSDIPEISIDLDNGHMAVEITTGLPNNMRGADLPMGISAIIEESSGQKSYWALAHPSGEPDFHHQDCFAAKL